MLITAAAPNPAAMLFRKAAERNLPAIFPTDTIYGIGAPLSSTEANGLIFKIKQRHAGFPFPILAGSMEQVEKIADLSRLSAEAEKYISKWPGPYTFIFKSKPGVPDIYTKNGTIAVRIPALQWLRDALQILGEPITATSVNINKESPLNNLESILRYFGHKISFFINGEAKIGRGSEIFDLSGECIVKVR